MALAVLPVGIRSGAAEGDAGGNGKGSAAAQPQGGGGHDTKSQPAAGDSGGAKKGTGERATPAVALWRAVKSTGSGVQDFFKNNNWALLVGVFLILYREQLRKVIASLERRGFSFEGAKITVTLKELATEAPLPRAALAPTPFDLDLPVSEKTQAGAVLRDLEIQLAFPCSDTVGREWRGTKVGGPLALRMIEARDALEQGCQNGADPSPLLLNFCRALEASRYLEAYRLVDLCARWPGLKVLLDRRKSTPPANLDDCLILRCLGTALAQRRSWAEAVDALTPLIGAAGQAGYLPAADVYLAALYNLEVKNTIGAGDDWPDFQALLQKIQPHVARLINAVGHVNWTAYEVAASNAPYYSREVLCAAGTILSLIAELPDADRNVLLTKAGSYLEECTKEICGEPPTSRDFNNLADFYRQLRRFDDGLNQIRQGRACASPDPILFETEAQLLHDADRHLESLLAIQAHARPTAPDASADELAQYVRNRMLFAKLAYQGIDRSGMGEVAGVVQILEDARQFVDAQRAGLGDEYGSLRSELAELLGYAYLAVGGVEKAEEEFRSLETGASQSERRWRRQVALARGHLAASRSERAQHAPQHALRHRTRAEQILKATARWRTDFPIDGSVSPWRRARRLRSHLDALTANVKLAEELLQAGEADEAKKRAEGPIHDLVGDVQANLDDPNMKGALGAERDAVEATLRRLQALESFILGRALLRLNPRAADALAFDNGLTYLQRARSLDATLSPLACVESGFAVVDAAFHAARGPLVSWHDRGVAELEDAVRLGDAAIRGRALRVLADVYGQRAAVERRQSDSAKS